MREIKFRVWDGARMHYEGYAVYIGTDMSRLIWMAHDDFEEEGDDKVIMQYTGLKDKNGAEIYEGDVIDVGAWKKYIVGGSVEKLAEFYYENVEFSICADSEVIGNVYENPDLV